MSDREILRGLASQVKELANTERMQQLKKDWTDHNGLRGTRPMILVSPEGSWDEILTPDVLLCEDPYMRKLEYDLRQSLYWGYEIKDDKPISEYFGVPYEVSFGPYGEGMEESKEKKGSKGSFHYNKLIEDLDEDFHKLKFREIFYDAEKSKEDFDRAEDTFGDILKVRHRGQFWWTLGITAEVIKLIGLEDLMLDMYDNPEGLHRLMNWFKDEHMHMMDTFENLGILSMNNEDELIASGGIGYCDELQQTDEVVHYSNMWGFAESQETVSISPQMFAEFVFPYQLPMLERFAINCYGCCEPIENRWEWVKQIPRLRRVSVSPWSNKLKMRDLLGKDYIYSRKPNPSYVCKGFDEEPIIEELREDAEIAKDVNMEIILKDTHTVENHPERFAEWVKLARKYLG